MNRRFHGPVWPCVGPDSNEHLSKFREEFLRRECSRDPRVIEYLAGLDAWKDLPQRVAKLEERVERLERVRQGRVASRTVGVPL